MEGAAVGADLDDRPEGYPGELVEVAFLDDGTEVLFRPILPSDDQRLVRLFYRLSPESLYRRFFAPVPRPQPALIRYLVNIDYLDRMALVAVIAEEIVGVARYDRLPEDEAGPNAAEVAVIVEDAWQGRGLATRLLWRLSAAARERGLEQFIAGVQAENRPMMGLLNVIAEDVEAELVGSEYVVRIWLAQVRPAG